MSSFVISTILQVAVALGLLNVWLVRAQNSTAYRGGSAQSLKEEFAAYGLPDWTYYAVGFLKVVSAIVLIIGIWVPELIRPRGIGDARQGQRPADEISTGTGGAADGRRDHSAAVTHPVPRDSVPHDLTQFSTVISRVLTAIEGCKKT